MYSDLEMLFVSASKEEEEEDTIEVPVPEQHKSRFCWRGLARRSFGERKILFEKLRIFFEKNLPNDENQRQMLEKLFFSNISDVVDKACEDFFFSHKNIYTTCIQNSHALRTKIR